VKTLLILRHAKSSWKNHQLADHDRPLKKRGRRDAPRVGELLQDESLFPDFILCSTAKRARETLDLLVDACGYDGEIEYNRDLYHTDAEDILEVLSELPEEYDSVMVVGHNPGLEELVEILSDEWVRLPTAALAHIELPIGGWDELTEYSEGELVNLWLPRDL
jgi:phosphohistidine phosphatase